MSDPIDTSTLQGMFSLQVLGAVAQLERALIAERTKAGIKAAKARGRLPGNPGLRQRRSEAIRATAAARDRVYLRDLINAAPSFLPIVQRMRPQHSWGDVVRVLEHKGQIWTVERLRRSVCAASCASASPRQRETFLRKRGFSKSETAKVIAAVLNEEGRPPESVFDFVQGITALARAKPHQDARLALEGKAKALLDRAA